jgi:hypothetical protein
MCRNDNLQQLLDLTQRLQMPGLLKVCDCMGLPYMVVPQCMGALHALVHLEWHV